MAGSIKVLVLAADPREGSRGLRIDHEIREMLGAIRRGGGDTEIEVASELAVRVPDLRDALLRHDPDIVHVAAHGHGADGILLDEGMAVRGAALAELFAAFPRVRMVVLNACRTAALGEHLSRVVDYTISMERPIEDGDAVVFAAGFYAALAFGRTVGTAFRTARAGLALDPGGEAPIPVLRLRDGVADAPIEPREPAPDEHDGAIVNRMSDVVAARDINASNRATGPLPAGGMLNSGSKLRSDGSVSFSNVSGRSR